MDHPGGYPLKLVNEQWVLLESKKRTKGRCATLRCTRPTHAKNKFCSRCLMRRWRCNNPIQDIFNHLKSNAKRRKIEFTLTFSDLLEFCAKTGYHQKRGKLSVDFHIDRIDPNQGYTRDNIQIMLASENCRKGNREDYLPPHVRKILDEQRRQEHPEDPF